MNTVVCPKCHAENPASKLICSQCGENLTTIKRDDVAVAPLTESPPSIAAAPDLSKLEKFSSRLQLAAPVILFLVTLLFAGYLLLGSQSVLLYIFCLGIVIGIGMNSVVAYLLSTSSPEEGKRLVAPSLPLFITMPITTILFILLLGGMVYLEGYLPFDLVISLASREHIPQILAFFNGLLLAAAGSQIWQSILHRRPDA